MLVESVGGVCWWRVLVESVSGVCWWRVLVECGGGVWWLWREFNSVGVPGIHCSLESNVIR